MNPDTKCMRKLSISTPRVLENLELSGYSIVAFDYESSEPISLVLIALKLFKENFIRDRDVYIYKRIVTCFFGDRSQLKNGENLTCWICQENFFESNENCLDLRHSLRNFLKWANDKSDLARRNIN